MRQPFPFTPDVSRLTDSRLPLEHALNDGEDYELCFTGEAGISSAIEIGRVIEESGVWIDIGGQRKPLAQGAFQHQL